MHELFAAVIWLSICALIVLFWWPLVVVVWQYWM